MNEDEMLVVWPSDELSRRLTSYAMTLNPSADASARMRRRLMSQARQARAESRRAQAPGAVAATAADVARPAESAARRAIAFPFARRFARPAAAGLLAAGLGVGAFAGIAAAADPGGPLYAPRLWVEMATLPASADARVAAEVRRLDARLDEARRATAGGNASGAEAALAAYAQVLDDAVAAASDPPAESVVRQALANHVDVLAALAGRVPPSAAPALQVALAHASGAIDRLDAQRGQPNPGPSNPGSNGNGAGTGNGNPDGNGNSGGNGNGAGNAGGGRASSTPTAHPTRSPKPVASPSGQRPLATPAPSARPETSATPSPSANGTTSAPEGSNAQDSQGSGGAQGSQAFSSDGSGDPRSTSPSAIASPAAPSTSSPSPSSSQDTQGDEPSIPAISPEPSGSAAP